ncbi:transposase [Acinetobacter indicus]|uniref:IS3 family transposase n=1 Tax=Acinetobacter indicus TaxID=756892 RepID=UPI0005F85976|nr:IS3 family transposase [Acinetobacter indicus]KJV43594.1 transposase [Acinetobacter indicus]
MDQLRKLRPVELVCRAFGILRSSYYHYRAQRDLCRPSRVKLKVLISSIFKQSRGSLGSRGIRYVLQSQGIKVGRYLIRKLMRSLGLISKQRRKHRYQSSKGDDIHTDNVLNRQFNPTWPNRVWTSDITYIWTGKSWAYLAVVLDLYARRVIGWSMSDQACQHLVTNALEDAWRSRGRPTGVIFHTDQGSQYKSYLFRYRLQQYAMVQSMSRRGNCWDNAPTERLFRSLKTEWIPKLGYHSIQEAKADIGFYLMRYYNRIRPHHFNQGVSPYEAEQKLKTVSNIC